ncbi:FtsX-like permease family protein [Micromonospora sp. LOL_024]|uniref:FtsX-like permease family protein n=1 Tax=Micromonospora sp. LOL_024 TaxID=3345412 RepID=UPI003A8946C2
MNGDPHPPERGARLAEAAGSWRAALRIARREARRARGRTALVLAMIILPVLAMSFIAASVDMARLTPTEALNRRLGNADAELRMVGDGPVEQDANGDSWATTGDGQTFPGLVTTEQVTALLPAGSRLLPVRRWVPIAVWQSNRIRDLNTTVVDLTDPIGRGFGRIHRGRAPATDDEIAVNPAARRSLGVDLGDRIDAGHGRRTWTIVGVVELPEQLDAMAILHPAGAPPPQSRSEGVFLADLPGPLSDDLRRQLNAEGVVVSTRVPGSATSGSGTAGSIVSGMAVEEVSIGLLVGGLGLLEVVLLVGPAFAVGVRRRRRELALVAVAGGDAAQLRRVVLADGVVLGCVGAVTGVALGVAAAFAGRPMVEQFVFQQRFGGYRVWPAALVAIALVAVLAGVLAALVPAWTAARQDVVAGLAGRRTVPVHRRRWLTTGLLLAASGTIVAAVGAALTSQAVILAGLVVGELGLVFATPTLVGLLARLGRFLPLAPRIAVRDASRNRSSAAPAISAVMAAVAGSVALGLFLASDEARSEQRYRPVLPEQIVMVGTNSAPGVTTLPGLAEIADPARAHLDAASITPMVTAGCQPEFDACLVTATMPAGRACPWQPFQAISAADQRRARADARCRGHADDYYGKYSRVAVDEGEVLPFLTGAAPGEVSAAAATLRAGGAVVTSPLFLRDGRLDLRVEYNDEARPADTATVPGYHLESGLGQHWLILSPAAADRLGLTTWPTGWVIETTGQVGQERLDQFIAATRPLGPLSLDTDRNGSGDPRPLLLLLAAVSAVVTVGAAGIATGLAAAEGRGDLSTLTAVGAGPGLRRLLSLCRAGVITVLGSALGIVAGVAVAVIVLTFTNQRYTDSWPIEPPYPLVIPWLPFAVLIAVPLVAMAGAALFTRSRPPVERRLD